MFAPSHPQSTRRGNLKKWHVFQLGSFVGQTRHSGDHREDFVTDQKLNSRRDARGGSLPHANSILILRIPLRSDFLQIIGRKQKDGRIQTSGLDSKGLSAIQSNSNLAKTLFEDYSFEG